VNAGNIVTTSLIGRSTSIGSPATFYRLFMERFLRDEALIERRYDCQAQQLSIARSLDTRVPGRLSLGLFKAITVCTVRAPRHFT
jgi:hypothetical protein